MIFNYFKSENASHLIDSFYEVIYESDDIPFESKLLPTGQSHLIYVYSKKPHEVTISNNKFYNKGLVLCGQVLRSYILKIENKSFTILINFHPTTLYKILKTDLSNYTSKHFNFKDINTLLYDKLNPIFESTIKTKEKIEHLEKEILKLSFFENNNTKLVDKAIDSIRKKGGLLSLDHLLKITKTSQKNLENQFKKIVGITPGKYIKLYRFFQLMKKYENQEIELTELIDMYNYYDRSHFIKDFKLFMQETPKKYFKKNDDLIKKYLKK